MSEEARGGGKQRGRAITHTVEEPTRVSARFECNPVLCERGLDGLSALIQSAKVTGVLHALYLDYTHRRVRPRLLL